MVDVYSDRHGVLKNKLNIKDSKQLEHAERLITLQNIAQLRKASFDKFDLDTLKAIHKKIFNSIYNWAGEIRTVNIQKGTMQFCDYSYITEQADGIFNLPPTYAFTVLILYTAPSPPRIFLFLTAKTNHNKDRKARVQRREALALAERSACDKLLQQKKNTD